MGLAASCAAKSPLPPPSAEEMTALGAEQTPPFEFVEAFLPEAARMEVIRNVQLGPDPSSQHFAERSKAIRFLTVIDGTVHSFEQDYFVQNQEYNDFSGGYKRQYNLIPHEVLAGPLADVVFAFTKRFDIPEKTVLLAQIQETIFKRSMHGRMESVTGQGIHTDGANRAAIVCLHRGKNVTGSLNQYHGALDGSEPLCEPTALEPGDISFFKDNELFHYVTPGGCTKDGDNDEQDDDVKRTIMIIHSPAEQYMSGRNNHDNILGVNKSEVKLREHKVEDLRKLSRARLSVLTAGKRARLSVLSAGEHS